MSKGLLERAVDTIKGSKKKRDTKLQEIQDRNKAIFGSGETKDDDSKRPQGSDS
jgi:hypothetical protein